MLRVSAPRLASASRLPVARFSTARIYLQKSAQEGGDSGFNKKEKSEEVRYVREKEAETLKKFRKQIAKQKQELEALEKEAEELEKKNGAKPA